MNLDERKRIARLWLELQNIRDVDAICAITAANWTMRGAAPDLPAGPAGVRELFRLIGPMEMTWTIDDQFGEGDKVLTRATARCVQEQLVGLVVGGRRQVFSAMFVHRITDAGLIEETWRNADDLGRLRQVGARIVAAEPA